jgi:hypothetical protein
MTPRTLKIIALTYVVKMALIGAVWIAVPDLPARAQTKAQQIWARLFMETSR